MKSYYSVPSVILFHSAAVSTNRNTRLTIIRDNAIIASHIAAFFSIFKPASYHLESHPDVSILNHQYITISIAMVASKDNTTFMVLLTVVNNVGLGSSSVLSTPTPDT